MVIGALQMNVIKKEKETNFAAIERLINRQVDLIVLPELFSTGYYFSTKDQYFEVAEEIPNGYSTKRLFKIAKEKNCYLTGAIVEKENGKLYITAIMVGPEGYIGKQRKRHLTNNEKNYFSSGETTEILQINGTKIGLLICFEGWFPERSRDLMLKGAQIICHTALTCQQKTLDIIRVRAIENKTYIIFANSISTDSYNHQAIFFRGDSRVIDYNGDIIVNAAQEEGLIAIEVDEKATIHKDLGEECPDLIAEVGKFNEFRV